MINYENFERHLRGSNLSENTISSYLFSIRQFSAQYGSITQKNLRAYKAWLIDSYKPQTVNLRLRAVNCYLESIGKGKWKQPFVRVQQKAFLENVISEADYEYFKTCLKRDGELFWYFVIRFLAATGARVSELIQIKAEHVRLGHLDLYSKGGKLRRICKMKPFPGSMRNGRKAASFFESLRGADHNSRDFRTVKKAGGALWHRHRRCLPALVPPSICKELLGEMQ